MRSGDRRTITVDGKKLDAEFLGQGHYAKAYRVGDDVYLFVTECYMKEAIEGIEGPHIPKVERHDVVSSRSGEDTYVYKMPFFEPLTPKHAAAWAQFRELQRATEEAKEALAEEYGQKGRSFRLIYDGYAVNDRLIDIAQVPASLKTALRDMASNASNYGAGVTFEFAKRNLGVDKSGNLILRDVLFDSEKLEIERARLMKHSRERQLYRLARGR
jgi:hypothetical protein